MRALAVFGACLVCACSTSVRRPVVPTDAAGEMSQVTRGSDNELDPAVSPDGKSIAYAVATATGAARRVEVASLADPRRVLYASNEVLGREPSWMPDGSGIVFVARSAQGPDKLVETFGHTEHRPVFLADVGDPNFAAARPAVSPNGKLVAMSLTDVGVKNPGWPTTRRFDHGIGVTDLGGTDIEVIGSGTDPAWSPDGKAIAFARQAGGHEHLFVANADGSGAHQVTEGTTDDQEPAWSPDGKHIVFCSAHGTDSWTQANLFVVKPDGSGLVQLTEGDRLVCHPMWARDGYVYFHANITDRFHIWRIRVHLPDEATSSI